MILDCTGVHGVNGQREAFYKLNLRRVTLDSISPYSIGNRNILHDNVYGR